MVRLDDLSESAIDWMASIKRANAELCAPALTTALMETGEHPALPGEVAAYLDHILESNEKQNEAVRTQCLMLGDVLANAGIEAVLLKGACWLFEDGPGRSDRMLRDVDFLVAPEQAAATNYALRRAGYYDAPIMAEDGHIHPAPLMCAGQPGTIEPHIEPTTRIAMLPGHEMRRDSTPVAQGLRLPSRPHRIVHNVLHAQLVNGDLAGGMISFRDTLDLARLIEPGDLDWDHIAGQARERGYFDALSAALHKAGLFCGSKVPDPFANDAAGSRHARRCLWQARHPRVGWLIKRWGIATRALAWERDSYALGLGDDRSLAANVKVNRRRLSRFSTAVRRKLNAR